MGAMQQRVVGEGRVRNQSITYVREWCDGCVGAGYRFCVSFDVGSCSCACAGAGAGAGVPAKR